MCGLVLGQSLRNGGITASIYRRGQAVLALGGGDTVSFQKKKQHGVIDPVMFIL